MMKILTPFISLKLATFPLCLLLVAGCGDDGGLPLEKAGGVVKYKGNGVAGAAVNLIYDDGQVASATTDENGKFNLTTAGRQGAPVGKAKVVVTKIASGGVPAMPANPKPEDMGKMYSNPQAMRQTARPKNELPERYAVPSSTPLEAEVSSSMPNDFTFELVD
jgi:hypothetical protein